MTRSWNNGAPPAALEGRCGAGMHARVARTLLGLPPSSALLTRHALAPARTGVDATFGYAIRELSNRGW
jgi:hypothetical protein